MTATTTGAPETRADDAGFTATVTVPAPPDAVFAYFTEPALFAQWFVVDGYATPAEEIRLDPRPGGAATGVMVSDTDGTRIPFNLRYGRVDPPRLVQFTFAKPDEAVTLAVHPMPQGLTRIGYHRPYGSSDDVHGAQSMLDALAASITRSAP